MLLEIFWLLIVKCIKTNLTNWKVFFCLVRFKSLIKSKIKSTKFLGWLTDSLIHRKIFGKGILQASLRGRWEWYWIPPTIPRWESAQQTPWDNFWKAFFLFILILNSPPTKWFIWLNSFFLFKFQVWIRFPSLLFLIFWWELQNFSFQ